MRSKAVLLGPILTALTAAVLIAASKAPKAYESEIEQWQRARQASLKSPDGWLTLAGLFWLKEGRNTVGAAASNQIVLPAGSAPAQLGWFDFKNGVTTFQAAPGVTGVRINGASANAATLKPDSAGQPDLLQVKALTMFVIQRGDRYAIRLKDQNSPALRHFTGLKYFPIERKYRVKSKFVPYSPPKKIAVPNILGQIDQEDCPGYVEFLLGGRTLRLDPVTEGDMLFFIFKDRTAERETYHTGRFLYTAMPQNGEVILDFNKAVNPPCAFTPYATCPLPPKENVLPIPIAAGELLYGH